MRHSVWPRGQGSAWSPCHSRLFEKQDAYYSEAVLPKAISKRVAIEAGIADYWYKYVGLEGKIIGMRSFGESAPADVLFNYFGITADAAYEAAVSLL